ncbi:PREDICTED: glycine-rich protein DOT1-like [Camelina sativa]|uniref:Glycine-rich protein DOT1-like n=1 Tax=Camelina sativa TaxID=90675 RepID=A0ABM1RSD6_CAMSA|nr:PREDICTED: glycine-rich protein DOT1-like [Camelina sativa]
MILHKSIKPILAYALLLLLAIYTHIQTVGSTTEISVSLANLKHSLVTRSKTFSENDFLVWRRELRSSGGGGGGGGRGGGGGSSGGRGSGSRGGGGSGNSGTSSGSSSGDCLKHYGLSKRLIFIGFLGGLVVVW